MDKYVSNKLNAYKFLFSITMVFLTLLIVMLFYNEEEKIGNASIITSTINDAGENYTINVDYPRFNDNIKITKIVTDYIYKYIKEFKTSPQTNKTLDITYELYFFDNYLNILFNIQNTISNIDKHNILINLTTNEINYISNIYDPEYIKNEINNIIYYKYSEEVYNLIKQSNINNHTYVFFEDKITIYFNDINFPNIDYVPSISINLNSFVFYHEDEKYDETKKYIAFTFDDGPSEHSIEILKTLEYNNASATFFMLGNKMKYNEDIIREIVNSNSEIASHTYSHKYLTTLSKDEILSEINSTAIIFNEITNKNISYLRPPYGDYNNVIIQNIPYPIILWNIDTKDWLIRDSQKISDTIITQAMDGSIILMHDTYKETAEAIKIVLPKLKELGFEVVNISKLAKYKNFQLKNGQIIRSIN